jgi:hypothetical protein
MSSCEPPLGLAHLRGLLARRHDIAVFPADALDRERPPEDLYFYRPAEVLVPLDQVELFTTAATRLGIRFGTAEDRSAASHPAGIARYFLGANAELDTVIERLIRATDGKLRLTPNHVLFTAEEWTYSPATEPRVAQVLPLPRDDGPASRVSVAVVDSGVPEGVTENPLLATLDVTWDEEEPWPYAGSYPVLTFPEGHGSFVAGVVLLGAPGAEVRSYLAADQDGVTDEWFLGTQIELALGQSPDVVNLSLGSTSRKDEPLLGLGSLAKAASADGGPIIVAAAGNLDSCRRFWPAAESWAIGVAAVYRPRGSEPPVRAWFSDYGPWVDVCAVGVDVVSAYEAHPYRPVHEPSELRYFEGAALWSGTSFAAPHVAAAVASTRASRVRTR